MAYKDFFSSVSNEDVWKGVTTKNYDKSTNTFAVETLTFFLYFLVKVVDV